MDKLYADSVRLLLRIAPDVFASSHFAMKGGTAINLFVQEMPRLSVDIDIVYLPYQVPREEALRAIGTELTAIADRLNGRGLETRLVPAGQVGDAKILINDGDVQVKVEANLVFRGSVLPAEKRPVARRTADQFGVDLSLPVLAVEELYGSKLVAAFDRQHPRDFFDVWQMYETVGLTDAAVECFVTYLAGHNRPIHEVLFPRQKNIEAEYNSSFVGMTTEPVALDMLLAARDRIMRELPARLTDAHRRFLLGFARAEPDFSLLTCGHAAELPALRWKLQNLLTFRKKRQKDFENHIELLVAGLGMQ